MAAPQREKAWQDFRAWALARGLKPLPAHPWTVAVYLRFCQLRHRPRTIEQKLSVIVRTHVFRGFGSPDKSPIVQRTMALLAEGRPPRLKRRTLFSAKDFVAPATAAADASGAAKRTLRRPKAARP